MSDLIAKQQAFKRLIANPDFQILVHEMNMVAKKALREQLDCDPFTEPGKIAERKILRTVLTVIIPARIQAVINYQPEAPDRQVEPQRQWKFATYYDQIRRYFSS